MIGRDDGWSFAMRAAFMVCLLFVLGCSSSPEFSGSSTAPSPTTRQLNCATNALDESEYERCLARARAGTEGAVEMLRVR